MLVSLETATEGRRELDDVAYAGDRYLVTTTRIVTPFPSFYTTVCTDGFIAAEQRRDVTARALSYHRTLGAGVLSRGDDRVEWLGRAGAITGETRTGDLSLPLLGRNDEGFVLVDGSTDDDAPLTLRIARLKGTPEPLGPSPINTPWAPDRSACRLARDADHRVRAIVCIAAPWVAQTGDWGPQRALQIAIDQKGVVGDFVESAPLLPAGFGPPWTGGSEVSPRFAIGEPGAFAILTTRPESGFGPGVQQWVADVRQGDAWQIQSNPTLAQPETEGALLWLAGTLVVASNNILTEPGLGLAAFDRARDPPLKDMRAVVVPSVANQIRLVPTDRGFVLAWSQRGPSEGIATGAYLQRYDCCAD